MQNHSIRTNPQYSKYQRKLTHFPGGHKGVSIGRSKSSLHLIVTPLLVVFGAFLDLSFEMKDEVRFREALRGDNYELCSFLCSGREFSGQSGSTSSSIRDIFMQMATGLMNFGFYELKDINIYGVLLGSRQIGSRLHHYFAFAFRASLSIFNLSKQGCPKHAHLFLPIWILLRSDFGRIAVII